MASSMSSSTCSLMRRRRRRGGAAAARSGRGGAASSSKNRRDSCVRSLGATKPRHGRVVCRAGEHMVEDEESPLDVPLEWVRAAPTRRPDVFREFPKYGTEPPMLPQKMPGDPPIEEELDEEAERKRQIQIEQEEALEAEEAGDDPNAPPIRKQDIYEDEDDGLILDNDEMEDRLRDFDIKDLPGFEA